jgi:hypothetical protein
MRAPVTAAIRCQRERYLAPTLMFIVDAPVVKALIVMKSVRRSISCSTIA